MEWECVEIHKKGVGSFFSFIRYEVGDGPMIRF
jgi:hypothetical protein